GGSWCRPRAGREARTARRRHQEPPGPALFDRHVLSVIAPRTRGPPAQRACPQQAAPAQGERPARRGGGTKNRQAPPSSTATSSASSRRGRAARRPSGRERHDEKITVYVSAEELMDLEHARLVLRGEHGLAVDRGRIVREAVAVVLADLESRGDASILVRRLRGR
uniref:hypothetical protein n=1 Tax=Streptomyces sp. PU-14G TaxID=2800808 RepID=UPI0034DF25E7